MCHRMNSQVKFFLFVIMFINVGLSFSLTKPESRQIIFNSDIELTKSSDDGKITVILTKNEQILVYNDNGKLIQKINTCPSSNLLITVASPENIQTQERKYRIQTKCKNGIIKTYTVPYSNDETSQNTEDKTQKPRTLLSINGTSCGDGNIADGEECDDGNNITGDGCSNCKIQTCGDNRVTGVEQCDDGNTKPDDGCSSTCMLECGNGIIQGNQKCDDGNLNDGDGCSSTCELDQAASIALPLAVGIPLGVLALAGIGGAVFAITKSSAAAAAGANYISHDPVRVIQVEQSTKIARADSIL